MGTSDPHEERPHLARVMDLAPHPEGGWYRETWRSDVESTPPGYPGPRASATAIHFLLCPGEESAWHVVRSAELWFWHRGGPLELLLGGTSHAPSAANTRRIVLGPDVEAGQVPQALVPPGGVAGGPTGRAPRGVGVVRGLARIHVRGLLDGLNDDPRTRRSRATLRCRQGPKVARAAGRERRE